MFARRVSHRTPMQRRSVVFFMLRGKRFALPPERIVDIVRIMSYTQLPSEDAANLGVVLHRDRAIPLVDLGPHVGIPAGGPIELPTLCVLALTNRGEVAFPVDQVLGFESSGERLPGDAVFVDLDQFGRAPCRKYY